MGIELSSNFDVKTALPLDSRLVVADQTARDAIDALVRYEGMIVYVEADETNYQLVGGITNGDWEELSSGGSGCGFGGKNYFVDPSFSENTDAAILYYEKTRAAAGAFDGGGSGYAEFTGHGASTNDVVMVYGDQNYPSGLTPGQKYYAVVLDANNLAFSATSGGSAIAFTNTNQLGNFTLRVYKAPGQFTTSVETSTPLAGTGSLKLTFTDSGASAVGKGMEIGTTTIDREDRGKTLYLRVSINLTSFVS